MWGGLLTFVGCYLTTYGLLLLSTTADMLEDERQSNRRIKNLDEMAAYIEYPGIVACKWIMMTCGVGIMMASTVSNIFIIVSYFEAVFAVDASIMRLVIFVAICLVLAIVIEPEKIQLLTYFTSTAIVAIGTFLLISLRLSSPQSVPLHLRSRG